MEPPAQELLRREQGVGEQPEASEAAAAATASADDAGLRGVSASFPYVANIENTKNNSDKLYQSLPPE